MTRYKVVDTTTSLFFVAGKGFNNGVEWPHCNCEDCTASEDDLDEEWPYDCTESEDDLGDDN